MSALDDAKNFARRLAVSVVAGNVARVAVIFFVAGLLEQPRRKKL